jgi:aldehyde dehydrogenase (NAD+)
MGKPLQETRGDVQEGIDTAYYAATEGRRLFGHTVPSELKAKWAMSYRRPIGVCGLVTPFNFPLAIPTWKMFPALLCGNAVVLKPAEDVPHTATVLVEILLEAGLPPEVIQLLHGRGESWGIVGIPDSVISFTGSTETGRGGGRGLRRMHKRLAGMGGERSDRVDDATGTRRSTVAWGHSGPPGSVLATSRLILSAGSMTTSSGCSSIRRGGCDSVMDERRAPTSAR